MTRPSKHLDAHLKASRARGCSRPSFLADERGGVGVVYAILAGSIAIPALVYASLYMASSNKSFERSTVRFDRPGTYVGGQASGGGASSSEVTVPMATGGGGQGGGGGQAGGDVLHNTGVLVSDEGRVGTAVGSTQSLGQPRSGLDESYAVAIASNTIASNEESGGEGDPARDNRSLGDQQFSSSSNENSNGTSATTSGESSENGSSAVLASAATTRSTRSAAVPVPGTGQPGFDYPDHCTDSGEFCGGAYVGGACEAHDQCYSSGSTVDRVDCDQQLRNDILAAGAGWLCAALYYRGVRLGGGWAYEGDGDAGFMHRDSTNRPAQCPSVDSPSQGPAVPTQRSASLSGAGDDQPADTAAVQGRTTRAGTPRSAELDECAAFDAAVAEQERLQALYDAALAAFIVVGEIAEGDNYGAGGALVGIVISYNTGDSLAGGAAAGAQIGSLIGILISGDEEALRDWAAAQATNYAVGQLVGVENAGFAISFVNHILDENYAGAFGLYLGTIACGPACGAFLDIVFTAAYGDYEEKKAKKKLRTKIWGWVGDAITNAQEGVAEAVQLAAEQGLCSTLPPIHIPSPDGDPDNCTKDYFDGFSKLSALAACGNKIKIEEYDRGGPNGGTEDFAVVYFDPECFDWQGRSCKKRRLTRSSLLDGSLDHLMQCDDPKPVTIESRTSTGLWRDAMYDECLSQRPGDPNLHGEQWYVEKQVRHLAYDLVNGKPGAQERLQQFLQGAAAAAWERAYNEAVATYCPQGADTPAALCVRCPSCRGCSGTEVGPDLVGK